MLTGTASDFPVFKAGKLNPNYSEREQLAEQDAVLRMLHYLLKKKLKCRLLLAP